MPLLLVLIFIVVPLAELYVIIEVVGQAIGPVWTILLLAADSILGAMLMKSQGRAVWRRFQAAMSEGRMPHREILDGVLVIFGGAFLITPGFITDVIGIFCLVPPTRALIRRWIVRGAGRRFAVYVADPRGRAPDARGGASDWDVEGTAWETREPPPRLER